MDEKLQEILDCVQKSAIELGEAAGDLFDAAGKRASSMLSVGKLNVRLADLRAQSNVLLQQVGEMVYGTHTGDIADSDALLEKLREIDRVKRQISDVTAEIVHVKQTCRICPLCGAAVKKGDCFCGACGTRL